MRRLVNGRSGPIAWIALAVAPLLAREAGAEPRAGISMPGIVQGASETVASAPAEAAESFLAHALPLATAGNPKFRSPEPGVLMAWITRSIAFSRLPHAKGITVAMSEEVQEFRNGVLSRSGSHDTEFSLADVAIAELRDGGDLTESGDKAIGVIFRCKSGKCIRAHYDGAPATVDATDISIQDDAMRADILRAFETLKRASDAQDP